MRGKVRSDLIFLGTMRDHPRLCGEKRQSFLGLPEPPGSPPPMRGKVCITHCKHYTPRITPAYAGKRNLWCRYQYNHRDHPRLCGEKQRVEIVTGSRAGSPPPMRGKVRYFGLLTDHKRITPAYAGKSPTTSRSFSLFRDHPRLCGEKNPQYSPISALEGSPPPMRGKDAETFTVADLLGITPAYAGKSAQNTSIRFVQ